MGASMSIHFSAGQSDVGGPHVPPADQTLAHAELPKAEVRRTGPVRLRRAVIIGRRGGRKVDEAELDRRVEEAIRRQPGAEFILLT